MTSRRELYAGICLILGLICGYGGQFIAAIRWPVLYTPRYNLIGDFSVRTCGAWVEDYSQRNLCSPGFVWFSIGLFLAGVAAAGAATFLVLHMRRAVILYALGASLILWAFLGADAHPRAHLWVGALTALLLWLSVLLLRPTVAWTWMWCVFSLIGMILALRHATAGPLGEPGLYQRMAIDCLSLGFLMHATWLIKRGRQSGVAQQTRRQQQGEERKEKDRAIVEAARKLEDQ
ncbi:hypothetical protein GSS88_02895 [Corynebacterium sp. 3HC-13]|uniref:hypothetical protein n=1 Tax=Corynebacterium poyangense TaxID=2684405 RepID=UPI001CCDF12D|nr:hypothetical protein [Corynebacterium poyangense]MBZ8176747.1 hypothetical protein [Corynebacterium poyangense]